MVIENGQKEKVKYNGMMKKTMKFKFHNGNHKFIIIQFIYKAIN